MKHKDIDFSKHVALIIGKGRKTRPIKLGPEISIGLKNYLEKRKTS